MAELKDIEQEKLFAGISDPKILQGIQEAAVELRILALAKEGYYLPPGSDIEARIRMKWRANLNQIKTLLAELERRLK